MNRIIITYKCCQNVKKKSECLKWRYGLFGKDYRVSTLSYSYLTVIGIIMQNFKIYRTILTCLNWRKELTVTEGRTDPDYREASLLKTQECFWKAGFFFQGRRKSNPPSNWCQPSLNQYETSMQWKSKNHICPAVDAILSYRLKDWDTDRHPVIFI